MANHRSHAQFISKLRAILEEHLGDEHFGVRELAEKAAISRSNLHRKVHAYNGNSTTQFIREFRLQKAMELLIKGEETVSEIAYQVGFSSPTYFNTCFKEYYGYPPGEAKIRAVAVEDDEDNTHVSDLFNQPEESTNVLHRKLKLTKRWIVALAIIMGVTIALAASYYISTVEQLQNTETVVVKEESLIAVLPFKNLSGDPDMDRICYAMTDAVISGLNELESLKVIPHNSVIKYRDAEKDIPTIAKELGVDRILLGNYQKYGEEAGFYWHLIDGPENSILTSKKFNTNWKLEEMFSIQAAVVENIATQLQIKLSNEERSNLTEFPTSNREAYDQWLIGATMVFQGDNENLEAIISQYEKAIILDANFIEPYLSIANLYLWSGTLWGILPEKEAWRRAKEYLEKAKEIDSTNSKIKMMLLDGLYAYEWDFEIMEKEFMESSVARAYLIQTGRAGEALDIINELIAKNPHRGNLYTSKVEALFHLHRYDEAIALLQSKDSLLMQNVFVLRETAKVYFYLKNYERSKWYLEQYMAKDEEHPPIIILLNALHNSLEGNTIDLELNLSNLKSLYKEESSGSPAWFLALYYSWSGDIESAFNWLGRSYDRHEVELVWLREEPILKPLRSDTRYVELYHKVGFPMPPHRD